MATDLVAPAPGGGAVPPLPDPGGRYYSMVVGEGADTVGEPGGSLLLRSGQVWVSSDLTRGRPLQASTGAATIRWRRAGLLLTAAAGSSVVIVATGKATLTSRGKKTVVRGGHAVRILADGTIDQKEPVRRDELLTDPWLASASGLPQQVPTRHGGRGYLAAAVFFALAATAVAVAPRVLNGSGATGTGEATAQSGPQATTPATTGTPKPSVKTPSATLAPSLAAPPPAAHTTVPGATPATGAAGSTGTTPRTDTPPKTPASSSTPTTAAATTTTTTVPARTAAPVSASTPNGATVTMQTCGPAGALVTATGTADGPAGASATVTVSFVTSGGTQLPVTVKNVVFTGTPVPWQASAPLPADSGGGRCWATIKS